jgi:hypothetical protein
MSATGRGGMMRERDFYPTPMYCVDLLLPWISLSRVSRFLEPCRGDGAIYDQIAVPYKEWCEIREDRDYLDREFPERFDLIITNPPFSLALEFLRRSLSEADTVIYLLSLNMLGAECRCAFWREQRPTHIFPLARRPSFTRRGTDQCNYGWFIWDRGGYVLGSYWLQVLSEQSPAPVRWPICTVCGAALTARRGAKTCGPKCRQKAYRQRVTDSVTDKPPVTPAVATPWGATEKRNILTVIPSVSASGRLKCHRSKIESGNT